MQILGIDVGGTGIKTAIVDTTTGLLLSERNRIATPRPATPEAIGKTLKAVVDQHHWSGPIGIGFPAAIQHGIARTAANIDNSFIGMPVAKFFSEQTGCPVYVANDADVAGLAEMRFGAGKDHAGVVLIVTIGTGLGTALFIDGHLFPNTELGHLYLENGIEAERYASESVRVVNNLKWKEWGPRFNRYLTTLESLLWPDLIVLGGGVSKDLGKFSPMITTKAPVVAASFLNQAGIVGAALFAEEQLKNGGDIQSMDISI
ncbi:polyphosphate--glucose phosphotransferase [Propionivibrio sp.]|uniref:polyphosphate--glucose phosphotransferase n=1 Tax=Propionivibrio sp. TaxID=2212460 RepID=UPI003BF43B69